MFRSEPFECGAEIGCHLGWLGLKLLGLLLAVLEAFQATGCIDQVGFTCVERMAAGANFNAVIVFQCRADLKGVATGSAGNGNLVVGRVDASFHGRDACSTAWCGGYK